MPEGLSGKVKTAFAILILAILSVLLFGSVISGDLLLTERDLSVFFIPPRLLWLDALRAGEFPLWNPYSYSGHPLFATLQAGVLYPVNIILLLLPFEVGFNWTIIVHFTLAGVFTFFLLRDMSATQSGAFTGALVFMLSGYLFSVHNVMSTLFSVTWAPLAILLFRRAVTGKSSRYAVLTGLALTAMFLGGGIEALFGTLLLLFVFALFPQALLVHEKNPIRNILFLATAAAVFLALSAVQLLPFLELANQSTRAGGLSYTEATTWSFDLKDFIQFLIPDPYGYGTSNEKYWSNQSWLKTVYLGLIPFVLAAFFFLLRKRKALPFAFLSIFFLILAMGKYTAFYPILFDYLPFLDKIRYPVKFLFAPFLLIAVASGLGFDALKSGLESGDGKTRRAIIIILGISTIAALAFGALNFFETGIGEYLAARGIDYPAYNSIDINLFNAKRVLFFYMVAAVVLYLASWSARTLRYLFLILPAILAIDLFFAHKGYYMATPQKTYYEKGPVMEFLAGRDEGLFRVFITPKTAKDGSPSAGTKVSDAVQELKNKVSGYNIVHRVFDSGGAEVMKRSDYTFLYDLASAQAAPDATNLLALMNVKYVVSVPEIKSPEFRLVKDTGREQQAGFKIYENLNYLPRFYMAYGYKVIKEGREYMDTLNDKGFKPEQTVLLDGEPGVKAQMEQGNYSVGVTSYRNNSMELKVWTDKAGLLVASESWYPGWKVYVDGKEEKLLKADLVFRAVPLEAGEHIVRFVYSPRSFKAGLAISGVSLLLIALFLVFPKSAFNAIKTRRSLIDQSPN